MARQQLAEVRAGQGRHGRSASRKWRQHWVAALSGAKLQANDKLRHLGDFPSPDRLDRR